MPQISVIVPVYKVEPYLYRCVDSILGQSFPDFELILVDDGSPDGCPAICDEYAVQDSRVVVIHQQNGGLSAARNAGIDWVFANSDSQWMTFVDSDDWVHPEYLERLLCAAVENNVSVSICGYVETHGEEPEIKDDDMVPSLWKSEDFFVEHNVNATIACGKLYQKECFQNIRYPVGKIHEDEFVTYKILFAVPHIAVLSEPLYFYYQNLQGITKSPWNCKRLDAMEAIAAQIQYFEAKGFSTAYPRQLSVFLTVVYQNLQSFRKMSRGSLKEIARYREMKRLAKQVIYQHQEELKLSWVRHDWLFLELYPVRARLFLHTRAAFLKFKRFLGRKKT